MDPRFDEVFNRPENSIFQVVFYPDRVYHARYLNATRSGRYRYNVTEVRSQSGILAMKGEVYLDGQFMTNFVRIEYRSERLVELAREKNRLVADQVLAWIKLLPEDTSKQAEATTKLHYCRWTSCYQVEIWQTLDLPGSSRHDFKVLDMMGRDGDVTHIEALSAALEDLKALRQIAVAVRENDSDLPVGYAIADPAWDNNFGRTHQEPRRNEPSDPGNTVPDLNYLLDFQRGWFLDTRSTPPVRYRNAMMDADNPEHRDDNVIEMRWLVQRAFGSTVVFFHEVTIPPGTIEGTHWHIGTEELYYIVEGQGIAYLGEDDDPATAEYPKVERYVMGIGPKTCREIPVKPGNVIYTKSGGIHGIRNPGTTPLRFVAFLYHGA
jgi:mannose-6-phosphate isomerase-like protein (cupin superfamily)